MLYAIKSTDVNDSLSLRLKTRSAHLERVQLLADQGKLITAGPHPAIDSDNTGDPGYTGSLIIAEFDSLEGANEWAHNDPYLIGGVYDKVIVKPFKKVLP